MALMIDLKEEKEPKGEKKNAREIADPEVVTACAKALRQSGAWSIPGSKMSSMAMQHVERQGK